MAVTYFDKDKYQRKPEWLKVKLPQGDDFKDIRDNLRELVEQAAAYSGAADEGLTSERIAQQEAQLAALIKERERLSGGA